MAKDKRSSFTEDPKLKPLYANLIRVGIAQYLFSDTFSHLMVEFNLDDEWEDCLDECEVTQLSVAQEYEDPFFLLLNIIYEDYTFDGGEEIIIDIVLDFFEWSPSTIDYKKIQASLKELEFGDDIVKKFSSDAKKLLNKKEIVKVTEVNVTRDPSKVFIIHGHDEIARLQLEKMLKEEFKLKPIVIQDNPNESFDTIISKFERNANECALAFALFTPDDKLSEKDYRARQNVILELGYFLGRDQQTTNRRIIILRKGNVEIPSDIKGVIYYQFESTIKELYLDLKKQLEYWKVTK